MPATLVVMFATLVLMDEVTVEKLVDIWLALVLMDDDTAAKLVDI